MLNQQNILIVDDNPLILKQLSIFLEANNYKVHAAKNGIEGLNLLSLIKFDLILLDIQMPELDGKELLYCLRKRKSPFKEVPVILITSFLKHLNNQSLNLYDFETPILGKPIKFKDLKKTMESILITT